MARILQDGFETEGRTLPSSYSTNGSSYDMDIAKFVCNCGDFGQYNKHLSGFCSSRGGYGQKAYLLEQNYIYSYYSHCTLKYDLTKNCNDTSELYCRVWVMPYSGNSVPFAITDVELEKGKYSQSSANSHSNCYLVTTNIDEATYKLDCYCKGTLVYSFNYLYYKQWVKIDVRLKIGDANNGIFQLRINDKLITTFNGLTGTTNPKYLFFGSPSAYDDIIFKCAIDDIAVNDTSGNVNNNWCGNGSIVGIMPTANGSKTMFTAGVEGTQNFENVDDITPDGDATCNSSYALDDIDLFKFTIPEELEIPPTETINAISIITSAKYVEQPTDIGHIVSDGVTDALIKQHIISNDYQTQSSLIQEKSDGTKYKVGDIEGLEFGYKTLESTQSQEE